MALFTDDFNRADANPAGGNWTTQGGGFGAMSITSNALHPESSGGSAAYVNSVTPNNDQYAQCTLGGGSGGGPAVRMATGANTGYGFQVFGGIGPATAALFYLSAGSYNSLTTASITHAATDVYKIQVVGTTIKAYQNGVEILSTTDATLASGRAGVIGYTSNIDDYECGNIGSSFQAAWARNSNQILKAR